MRIGNHLMLGFHVHPIEVGVRRVPLPDAKIPAMACPFFLPEQFLEAEVHHTNDPKDGAVAWSTASLGDLYAGSCHAQPDKPWVPDERHQRIMCNRGYAREQCARFPAGTSGDMVRFSVAPGEDGIITVLYAIEADYRPAWPVSAGGAMAPLCSAKKAGTLPTAWC